MEPRLNVALAGFGAAGQRFHAPFLTADRRFRLCKILTTRKLARERYPDAQTVSRFEELLTPEIDLVILATPNALHVPQAQQAVLAGKHVLVEKPIAATADEARALFTLAKERGVVLTVHQNRRFDGGFRTVQQLIERGDLGEVLDYAAHFAPMFGNTVLKAQSSTLSRSICITVNARQSYPPERSLPCPGRILPFMGTAAVFSNSALTRRRPPSPPGRNHPRRIGARTHPTVSARSRA